MSGAVRLIERGKSYVSSQVKKRLEAEMLVRPTRLHSMENVHTPDLRGFPGFPKPTKVINGMDPASGPFGSPADSNDKQNKLHGVTKWNTNNRA